MVMASRLAGGYTTMTNQLTFYSNTAEGWERSLMAFLAEKERPLGPLAARRWLRYPRAPLRPG